MKVKIMRFDAMKAVEAAAVIARRDGKRLSRMRLLKLLYITERSLAKTSSRRLIRDRLVAMDHGPLHSNVYDMIKGVSKHSTIWSTYFTNINARDLELTKEPELLLLSRHEIEALNKVVDDCHQLDDWALSKATHKFEEWIKRYTPQSSTEIKYKHMTNAVGRSDEFCKDIEEDMAFEEFFEQ